MKKEIVWLTIIFKRWYFSFLHFFLFKTIKILLFCIKATGRQNNRQTKKATTMTKASSR